MGIAFLLHLYQPPTQDEATFKKVAEASYIPLVRTIKNYKKFNLTLNMPLSFLELLDRFGYESLIKDIKGLVASGRVTLTGSAAYHPLLTKIPQEFAEKQITLNEFGLGYYFGRHSGFEGEKAVLIKDVAAFFPPELAVNKKLLSILEDFNYTWVLVDETFLPADVVTDGGVYKLPESELKIVCRNRALSNAISFKRDLGTDDILSAIRGLRESDKSAVIALDGEVFGHHFTDGIYLLESVLSAITGLNIPLMTVDDCVDNCKVTDLADFRESSWGASEEEMVQGHTYPMWDVKGNKIHKLQWDILKGLVKSFAVSEEGDIEGFETLAIWVPSELSKIEDSEIREQIFLDLLVNKALNSDQFWWASGKKLLTGETLYSTDMIERSLQSFEELSEKIGDEGFKELVKEKSLAIRELL